MKLNVMLLKSFLSSYLEAGSVECHLCPYPNANKTLSSVFLESHSKSRLPFLEVNIYICVSSQPCLYSDVIAVETLAQLGSHLIFAIRDLSYFSILVARHRLKFLIYWNAEIYKKDVDTELHEQWWASAVKSVTVSAIMQL